MVFDSHASGLAALVNCNNVSFVYTTAARRNLMGVYVMYIQSMQKQQKQLTELTFNLVYLTFKLR